MAKYRLLHMAEQRLVAPLHAAEYDRPRRLNRYGFPNEMSKRLFRK
jgi:hypothetical protein